MGHGRVLFNGNNYDPAWTAEAKRRGVTLTALLTAIYMDTLQEAQDAMGLPQHRSAMTVSSSSSGDQPR